MSKLTEKTSQALLWRYAKESSNRYGTTRNGMSWLNQKFHDHLDQGHPLNTKSRVIMAVYGDHTIHDRLLDQPTLEHHVLDQTRQELGALKSTLESSMTEFPNHERSAEWKSTADTVSQSMRKLHRNFPEYQSTLDREHVHKNVKYRKSK